MSIVGHNAPEIASKLDISAAAVRKRLQRARVKVRSKRAALRRLLEASK